MQTRLTENEGLDPGNGGGRRSVFIQTLPSKEQREHEVTNRSWKLASMD